MVATPSYLKKHGTPRLPADLTRHNVLIYSTVLGDDRLHFARGHGGRPATVAVHGSLRSNNLSAILHAVHAHMGLAALPWYVAAQSIAAGRIVTVLDDCALPAQEIHAVYASPKNVPAKVTALVAVLQDFFQGEWWERKP
jgi:DNA-binding transcriptional LysR family regulator